VGVLTIQHAIPATAPADHAVDNGNLSVIWRIDCDVALYEVKRIALRKPSPSRGGRRPVKREVA
jgi:hypothetical protein